MPVVIARRPGRMPGATREGPWTRLAAGLRSAGVAFALPLRQMPYGRELYLKDPDGYILGFVQPAEA